MGISNLKKVTCKLQLIELEVFNKKIITGIIAITKPSNNSNKSQIFVIFHFKFLWTHIDFNVCMTNLFYLVDHFNSQNIDILSHNEWSLSEENMCLNFF